MCIAPNPVFNKRIGGIVTVYAFSVSGKANLLNGQKNGSVRNSNTAVRMLDFWAFDGGCLDRY